MGVQVFRLMNELPAKKGYGRRDKEKTWTKVLSFAFRP